MHKYHIYRDPIPHPVLREGVVRKLIDFVCRTMAIAQLTHLHLTIPASGSVVEPVPEECYPAVPLPRVPVSSRRVSFTWEVAVIESAPLCPPDWETDSLIDPAVGGTASADQCLIQFHQPDYTMFPREDPKDELNDVPALDFPSIPTQPGFHRIIRPGDTP